MTYHSGAVSGEIIWEEVQLDRFAIAYQAFSTFSSFLKTKIRLTR